MNERLIEKSLLLAEINRLGAREASFIKGTSGGY